MKKRGVTNIIATMLIFGIMIASMGVLYSRISPTIFQYEAETQTSNQEFILQSIANVVQKLISSAEDSQSRIKIISNQAIYSVNNGHQITISLSDNNGQLLDDLSSNPITILTNLGSFTSNVSSTFQGKSGTDFLGRVSTETTFLALNQTEPTNYVSKVVYSQDIAKFSLYFRPRISISNLLPSGEYDINIQIVKIEFQSNFADFPVNLDEWSLRLRRRQTIITNFHKTGVTGLLTFNQIVDGVSLQNYDFNGFNGKNVNVNFIEIPILFTI